MTARAQPKPGFGPPATYTAAAPKGPSGPTAPHDHLKVAALVALAVAAFGLVAHAVIARNPLGQPHPASFNVFFRLYALHEAAPLWLLALTAGLTWVVARWMPGDKAPAWAIKTMGRAARVPTWAVGLAVLTVTLLGGVLILHGLGLAMDEFAASFQAKIFASGRLQAEVPQEWRGLAPWMTPVFVNYKPAAGVWVASYLPVYSAIRAVFALAGVERLTNPVLAALTVALVIAIARRMSRPDQGPRPAVFAMLFLVLSTQFLVTSMGAYSMPAHLCLNLLWLWLYLRNDAASLAAAPLVGVLAMGLHNPVPHALFVAPFLVRMVRDRRYVWIAYFAAVYGAGAYGWYQWLQFVQTDVDGSMAVIGAGTVGSGGLGGGVFNTFAFPTPFRLFVQGMSVALLLTWQTPAVAIFLAIALLGWKRLGTTERDLAAGLVATFAFYTFFNADQGHGWGYRYMHPVLGNAVLLAAVGAVQAWRGGREALVTRLVIASALFTVALQFPLRTMQIERFVRPVAATVDYIAGLDAEIVTVNAGVAWYARDFVRNDPFLATRPKLVGLHYVNGRWPHVRDVPRSARDKTLQLTARELDALGVPVFAPPQP